LTNQSTRESLSFGNAEPITSTDYSNSHAFEGTPGSNVSLAFSVASAVPQGTSLTFTVSSPSGQELYSETFGPGDDGSFEVSPEAAGEYTIDVAGQGAAASYEVAGTVEYRPVVIYLWWEDVLFDQAAADRADEIGASTHAH
jgi:hypothetical protein